ncbi:uL13 family ribosomal protein, partial [Pseudomonadota bacterium]
RYPGGFKEVTVGKVMEQKPELVVQRSIAGMIPKNKLRQDILAKLKIYAGAEHEHSAQNPAPLEI